MVRHGPGPFPTFDPDLTLVQREPHNDDHGWQGRVRKGALDLVLVRYALEACGGVDGLAVTWLDGVTDPAPVCDAYRVDGTIVTRLPSPSAGDHAAIAALGRRLMIAEPIITRVSAGELMATIERAVATPVRLVSTGPTAADWRWLRRR